MASAVGIRDEFLATLDHIDSAFGKLHANTGRNKILSFPDLHKTSEGLFLSAWTHWEQFIRDIFLFCLATDPAGKLRKEIKGGGFRLKGSSLRLAEIIADHPDDDKWVEWSSVDIVLARANQMLSTGHPFSLLAANQLVDIRRLKKIRNAVAHKSDKAWSDFRVLAAAAPYSLAAKSMKGLTTGRFLTAHKVGAAVVFSHSIMTLRSAAQTMVP